MKELLRQILFPFMPEEIEAVPGTLKFSILNWLYEGDFEEIYDLWVYPEEDAD